MEHLNGVVWVIYLVDYLILPSLFQVDNKQLSFYLFWMLTWFPRSSWSMTTCDRFRDRQQNCSAPGAILGQGVQLQIARQDNVIQVDEAF